MRVLIVVHGFPPASMGGTEVYAAAQARALTALGDEVRVLARESAHPGMELAFEPFSMEEALRQSVAQPPATLLVLPNGWVKVAAALPEVCADLRREKLENAWESYRRAWRGAEPCAPCCCSLSERRSRSPPTSASSTRIAARP